MQHAKEYSNRLNLFETTCNQGHHRLSIDMPYKYEQRYAAVPTLTQGQPTYRMPVLSHNNRIVSSQSSNGRHVTMNHGHVRSVSIQKRLGNDQSSVAPGNFPSICFQSICRFCTSHHFGSIDARHQIRDKNMISAFRI